MQVRLKRKLAECIDGVDLSGHKVGDIFELPVHHAHLLVAEGWADIRIAEVKVGDFRPASPQTVNFATGERVRVSDLASRVLRTLERIRQNRIDVERRW